MIAGIPNQPLAFLPTLLQGCLCADPQECLLVDETDTLSTQLVYEPCLSAQLLASPDFDDASQWAGHSWTVAPGNACITGVAPWTDLTELSFAPTIGVTYLIRVRANSIVGPLIGSGIRIEFAGALQRLLQGAFTEQQWIVTATSTQPVIFASEDDGSGCIEQVEVYDITPLLLIELVDDTDTVIADLSYAEAPSQFVFDQDRVTMTFDVDDLLAPSGYPPTLDGCYTLRITDACDNTQLTSQCLRIDEYTSCTIQVKACNAGDGVGFIGDFEPIMRVYAKLTRPSYEYEVAEERWSNGRINRYFADRRRTMELRVDGLGEKGHEFWSTLPLWDHVYIGPDAYVVKAEKYQPVYADVWEARGGILMTVEPYEELARKVRCAEDSGGCAPPPNYLVQGTGPNEDYVLQSTDGSRILLH